MANLNRNTKILFTLFLFFLLIPFHLFPNPKKIYPNENKIIPAFLQSLKKSAIIKKIIGKKKIVLFINTWSNQTDEHLADTHLLTKKIKKKLKIMGMVFVRKHIYKSYLKRKKLHEFDLFRYWNILSFLSYQPRTRYFMWGEISNVRMRAHQMERNTFFYTLQIMDIAKARTVWAKDFSISLKVKKMLFRGHGKGKKRKGDVFRVKEEKKDFPHIFSPFKLKKITQYMINSMLQSKIFKQKYIDPCIVMLDLKNNTDRHLPTHILMGKIQSQLINKLGIHFASKMILDAILKGNLNLRNASHVAKRVKAEYILHGSISNTRKRTDIADSNVYTISLTITDLVDQTNTWSDRLDIVIRRKKELFR